MDPRAVADESCVLQVPQVVQNNFKSLRKQFLPLVVLLCWATCAEEFGWVTAAELGLGNSAEILG